MRINSPFYYLVAAQLHSLLRHVRSWVKKPVEAAVEVVGAERRSIQQVLNQRPADRRRIYSLPLSASARDATSMMLRENISVVVAGSHGILTTTDILQKVVMAGRDPVTTTLADIATPLDRCAYVFMENDVESALSIMAGAGVHHLPVMDESHANGGRIVAVVSLPELSGLNRQLKERRLAAAAAATSATTSATLTHVSSPTSSPSQQSQSQASSVPSMRATQTSAADTEASIGKVETEMASPVSSWDAAKRIVDDARRRAEEELEISNSPPAAAAAAASAAAAKRATITSLPA